MFFRRKKSALLDGPLIVPPRRRKGFTFEILLGILVLPGVCWVFIETLVPLNNILSHFGVLGIPEIPQEVSCKNIGSSDLTDNLYNILQKEGLCSSLEKCKKDYRLGFYCYHTGIKGEVYGIADCNIITQLSDAVHARFTNVSAMKFARFQVFATKANETQFPLFWASPDIIYDVKFQRR